jgi:hypothetical protein
MNKRNTDYALAEECMRILLEIKNDLSRNSYFKVAGVVEKEQVDALASLFNAIDGMIAADARVLASG